MEEIDREVLATILGDILTPATRKGHAGIDEERKRALIHFMLDNICESLSLPVRYNWNRVPVSWNVRVSAPHVRSAATVGDSLTVRLMLINRSITSGSK